LRAQQQLHLFGSFFPLTLSAASASASATILIINASFQAELPSATSFSFWPLLAFACLCWPLLQASTGTEKCQSKANNKMSEEKCSSLKASTLLLLSFLHSSFLLLVDVVCALTVEQEYL
jgi:hypothetical protein